MSAEPVPQGKGPLIPETYLDSPSQRLYYLSLGLLCQVCCRICPVKHTKLFQAIKVVDFLYYIASSDDTLRLCKKWLMVDFVYCILLSKLRIPRLKYSTSVVVLQIACLWFLNGLMFGGVSLNLGSGNHEPISEAGMCSSVCTIFI